MVDLDTTPSISQKQNQISNREEAVKEKVTSLFLIPVFHFVFDYKMEMFIVQIFLELYDELRFVYFRSLAGMLVDIT